MRTLVFVCRPILWVVLFSNHAFMKLLLLLSLLFTAFGAIAQADPLTLPEVESATLSQHPSLAAAGARWQAMQERIPQARAWDDPELGIQAEQGGGGRFNNTEWMLSQTVPLSGSAGAEGRVASAEAAVAYGEWLQIRNELLMKARVAYVDYLGARERLSLNLEQANLLGDVLEVVQAKLDTGEMNPADQFQAETEVALLEDERAELARQELTARVQLNTLMGRPLDAGLGSAGAMTYEPLAVSVEPLIEAALRHHPDVVIAEQQIEVESQKADLANRQRRPDPRLFVEARQFDNGGGDFQEVDFGLSLPLTWLNPRKYNAANREAGAMTASVQADLESIRRDLTERVRLKYEEAAAAGKRYLILRNEVVPQAEKALDARAADFSSRKASFLEYNSARVLLQRARTSRFDRLTAYETARRELQTLVEAPPAPSLK